MTNIGNTYKIGSKEKSKFKNQKSKRGEEESVKL
jgi:hypothetical protein